MDHHASSTKATLVTPALRTCSFDPLRHAKLFVEDDLQLVNSKQGNPKLFVIAKTDAGVVDAGSITWIPATSATLAGPAFPSSIAITGRMAEYTEQQRGLLKNAGLTFKPKAGMQKIFYSAYCIEKHIPDAITAFTALKTSTGKDCLLGQFTARAVALFQRRMLVLRGAE